MPVLAVKLFSAATCCVVSIEIVFKEYQHPAVCVWTCCPLERGQACIVSIPLLAVLSPLLVPST